MGPPSTALAIISLLFAAFFVPRTTTAAAALDVPAGDGASQPGRVWYIAAEDTLWDYLPGGQNHCMRPGHRMAVTQEAGEHALWTTQGLGSTLKKAVYRQYSDASFQEEVPKPEEFEHTGLLGPVMRMHVGETITVVFQNRLPFPVNLEPSGLQPAPLSSGGAAAAADAAATFAPAAAPNETVTYTWVVPEAAGPSPGDPEYKLWLYRSTVDINAHDNAGLVGPILVGRSPAVQGASEGASQLAPESERDIIVVFEVINENSSPFLEDNLAGRGPAEVGLDSEEDLEESLLKHTINGYLYCSGPQPEIPQGERVRWHLATVGTEVDLHTAHWHGNTFLHRGLRDDQLKLIPGSIESVVMDADNAGTWLLHCHVNDHLMAGMMALYSVLPSNASELVEAEVGAQLTGTTRRYFVAAEEVIWNYAPLGGDRCSGSLLPWSEQAAVFVENGTARIGSRYIKAQYIEYTDDSFTVRKERAPEDDYMGLLGPTLRAEVGDVIQVEFLNRLRYPASMHPHGVRYGKASEGSPYNDGTRGASTKDDAVAPGAKHTYTWQVPETAGPGPAGGPTRLWMYHSHTNEIKDTYAGLVGGIVVGNRGALAEGSLAAKDVDREVVLFFSVMDEGSSFFFSDNFETFLGPQRREGGGNGPSAGEGGAGQAGHDEELEHDEDFIESNLMHAINGFVYCNAPPLRFDLGQRIRFYVMALGTEVDMHTPQLQRSVLHTPLGAHTLAALSMLPGSMHTVDMVAETVGGAVLQCRVGDHIAAGMAAVYTVAGAGGPEEPPFAVMGASIPAAEQQRYFIAAELVEWDYAPLGLDGCTGEAFGEAAAVFVEWVNGSAIGSRYLKALYRQYTDDTFTQQVPQPPEAGILGPTLLLEAGQSFQVHFLNRLPFAANLAFDGALLAEQAQQEGGAEVAPGGSYTYSYRIPDSMAPGSSDLSTVAFGYTSSVDPVSHPNAGLIGMLLVAAPGSLCPVEGEGAQGSEGALLPEGVDRLVPLLFNIQNENESPLLGANMEGAGVAEEGLADPAAFEESNLMHSINGFVYCNLPDLAIPLNSTTRFVLLGMGSEADMHSPVFTGQVLHSGVSTSKSVELMPTVTKVVDLVGSTPGRWPLYCDVHDHWAAGMQAAVVVS